MTVYACMPVWLRVGGWCQRGFPVPNDMSDGLSDFTSSLSFRWMNTHAVITLVCWEPLSAAKVFVTENKGVKHGNFFFSE